MVAVFWLFEAEERGQPYLILRASAAIPYSSAERGSRLLTRGTRKGSTTTKPRQDNTARHRERGIMMREGRERTGIAGGRGRVAAHRGTYNLFVARGTPHQNETWVRQDAWYT